MEHLPLASNPPSENGDEPFWRQIFDPESIIMVKWNRFALLIGTFNVFVDPFFPYLLVASSNTIAMDVELAGVIAMLRMIGDFIYMVVIIVKFRTAYEAPGPRVFRKRELVVDPQKIAKRYVKSIFLLDLLAILPLPQAYIWAIWHRIPTLRASSNGDGRACYILSLMVCFQMVPRVSILFHLRKNVTQTSGMLMKHDWSGAVFYLLLYIMNSHVIGSTYYMAYILQLLDCRETLLDKETNIGNMDWNQIIKECSMSQENTMFSDAYEHAIASRHFSQRFMYCFSWGLKCLSSMAQNFGTSYFISETGFSFLMTIFGLILFAGLIAQMQTSIQSLGNGEELQMVRQRQIDEWVEHHELPSDLRKSVKYAVLSERRATMRLDDEAVVDLLPPELRCEIRRHLYLELARTLPFFAKLERQLVHSFCGHLRAFSSSKGSYITVEGEPLRRMFFIVGGQLEVLFIDGGCTTSPIVGRGDVCGEDLFSWALSPSASAQILPTCNQTLKCLTNIEAFFIWAEDLKLLAIQFGDMWNFEEALRLGSP